VGDLTAIYYTCNREHPEFERRIQETLLEAMGDTPLISVSKKPIDFGRNICVGDVPGGDSSQNAYRQFQIGAKAATTKWVCPAEADFLYPPEYFTFEPEREDTFYVAKPLWVLFAQRGKARVYVYKPRGSEAAMMVGRKTIIDRIEYMLNDFGEWGGSHADGHTFTYLLNRHEVSTDTWILENPIVTFKTDRNMHRRTPHDVQSKRREIPYWGSSKELIERYLG
jgi:hypothetical protein